MLLIFKGKLHIAGLITALILILSSVAITGSNIKYVYAFKESDERMHVNNSVYQGQAIKIFDNVKMAVLESMSFNNLAKQEELKKAKLAEEEKIAAEKALKEKEEQAKKEELRKKAEEEKRQQEAARKRTLENLIYKFLGDMVGNIGMVYYDLSSENQISINADKVFMAASTIKVPLTMVIYDLVASGKLKESNSIKYTDQSWEEGTGVLQNKDLSSPIKISTLAEYAIRYSDNIAVNMLIAQVGHKKFKDLEDEKLGISTNHAANEMTARGAFNMLKKLNEGASAENKYYAKIINWMMNTVFHDRIDRDISSSIVAHKIGNYGTNVHDIGIIYTPKPYILAVFTSGLTDPNSVIAGLSNIIYDSQVGK